MGARDDDDDDDDGCARRRAIDDDVVTRIFTHRVVVSSPSPTPRITSRASASQSPQPYRPYLIARSSHRWTPTRTCASTAPATPRESAPLDTFSANSFKPARAATGLVDLRFACRVSVVSRRARVAGRIPHRHRSPAPTATRAGVGGRSLDRARTTPTRARRRGTGIDRTDAMERNSRAHRGRVVSIDRSVARARGSRDPIVRDRSIARSLDRARGSRGRSTSSARPPRR